VLAIELDSSVGMITASMEGGKKKASSTTNTDAHPSIQKNRHFLHYQFIIETLLGSYSFLVI
jgi:hypothetical protein